MGLLHAIRIIYKSQGVRGLYQGHSMTLLRIFPYAGIKYMAYDALEGLLIPTPDKQTSGRLFLAGALSGMCLRDLLATPPRFHPKLRPPCAAPSVL
jgi:solute carrier family 25 protein 16